MVTAPLLFFVAVHKRRFSEVYSSLPEPSSLSDCALGLVERNTDQISSSPWLFPMARRGFEGCQARLVCWCLLFVVCCQPLLDDDNNNKMKEAPCNVLLVRSFVNVEEVVLLRDIVVEIHGGADANGQD